MNKSRKLNNEKQSDGKQMSLSSTAQLCCQQRPLGTVVLKCVEHF